MKESQRSKLVVQEDCILFRISVSFVPAKCNTCPYIMRIKESWRIESLQKFYNKRSVLTLPPSDLLSHMLNEVTQHWRNGSVPSPISSYFLEHELKSTTILRLSEYLPPPTPLLRNTGVVHDHPKLNICSLDHRNRGFRIRFVEKVISRIINL